MRDLRAGALRLGATDTPARSWVPRILSAFRARHPGVRVQLHVGNTRQVMERLLSREDDVAVIAGSPQHPDLVVEHIADDPLVVIVPRRHAWRARPSVSLQDVCGQALILREEGSSTRQLLETEFSRKLLRPNIVMELGSHDAIIGAVEQDVGISILPLSLVRRDVERRAVCALPLRPARLRHAVCLVYHAERAAFPLTRRLIEISRELQRSGAFPAAGTNSPSVSRRSGRQPRRQTGGH
jgi:DNA-binding transcriptional LysR family regulator